jgi:hypothetical protein
MARKRNKIKYCQAKLEVAKCRGINLGEMHILVQYCQADPEIWHKNGEQMQSIILSDRAQRKRVIKRTVVAQNSQADPEMSQKGE